MLWLKKLLVKIIWGKNMDRHTYSISTQTLNGVVAAGKLHGEIEGSVLISEQLLGVSTDSDDCHCDFFDTLTSLEITTLSGIVATHDGIPEVIDEEPQEPVSAYLEETVPTSTTDDSTWTDKLDLGLDPVEYSGRYKVSFSAMVSVKSRQSRIRCRIRHAIIGDPDIERKVMDFISSEDTTWVPYVGHFSVDLESGDRYRVQMQFRTTAAGREVGIRDANLTVVRIAA